jgi:uncharacterized cupredoxin-like copper-binding protein
MAAVMGLRLLLLTLALGAMLACGGGGGGSTGSGQPAGSTKVVEMDFQFQPKTLSVSAGKVTFWLVNNGPSAHDMVIADPSGKTVFRSTLVQPNNTEAFDATLTAGSYVFYCDVPGHRAAGMEGTLTVS